MDLYYDKVTGTYGDLSEIVACLNMPTVGDDFTGEDVGFYAEAHGKRVEVAEDKGYQGWSSYPTWAVKLWIDNDEGSYNVWREQARETEAWSREQPVDWPLGPLNLATHRLADHLKEEHEESADYVLGGADGKPTVFNDLMGYALGQVNWREIAESLIAEVIEEDAYIAANASK